jgi:hypothetical protein
MRDPELDILAPLPKADYARVRQCLIDIVLATDLKVGGSGRVAVIRMALDRGDRGGHFGANLVAWLWLGRWLGGSGDWADFF